MIEVRNLTKRYGDHVAVDHLSFTIEPGKIYGLLGPNGAGKSTTMNMITGCLAPTSGEIRIGGYDLLKNPKQAKKHIGYLPEIPPLYLDMTPYEYLTFVAEAKGVRAEKAARQVEQAMKLTYLTDVEDRLISNLSKGYRQRVGIAQALLGNPDVIILDEPTVGLDPKQIIEIRDLIRRLGEVKTVILSSHILAEIEAVCDHVMIISHGHLVANDTVENLEDAVNRNAAIALEIKGDVSDVVRILQTVPGIGRFTPIRGKTPGTVEVRLTTEAGADPREEIFRAFAKENIPLISMHMEILTLEDIFLRLTDDARAAEDEPADASGESEV
ncbi:MAG: ABC transporter ATP-binding protein [Clostridia bacterium]|nr:ABC transporter ATP-binding protein [Clostridia bacterium]